MGPEGIKPMIEQEQSADIIEKQKRLEDARLEVEQIVDALGKHIDEGIKEGIAVFRASDINTTGSCEGHDDHGTGGPYIDVESKELDVLQKKLDTLPQHEDPEADDPQREAIRHEMLVKNLVERKKLAVLLEEFYSDRPANWDARLYINSLANGWSRLESQGVEFQDIETDPSKKKENLGRFQYEMQDFIAFAKKKFFEKSLDTIPKKNQERNTGNLPDVLEFRKLLKDVFFTGDAVAKWKEIFPRESKTLETGDPDAWVEKYLFYLAEESGGSENLQEFTEALQPHFDFIRETGVYPTIFRDLFLDWKNRGNSGFDSTFANKEKLSAYIYNATLRDREKIQEEPRRMEERFRHNLLADPQEVNAGVYREELEPQVSGAVFSLRAKGYNTFQSGYSSLENGSQFIDFRKEDTEFIKNILNDSEIKNLFQSDGVSIESEEFDDRLTVTLKSEDPKRDLEFWKRVWDAFAEKMPDRGFSATPPIELGSYATFIERQHAIRNKKKTYLGNGLEFDGKNVKRTESNE
jgi:hypothetical protein